jgi:hypothetical protein
MALSDTHRAIIDLERTWWTEPGPKERRIREALAMSPSAYYRALVGLLDDDDAMTYDPLVIRRVQRTRERRLRSRFEGRSAEGPPNS